MKLKQTVQEYFTFDKRNRNGIMILVLLIAGVMLYLQFPKFFSNEEQVDFARFEEEIKRFEAAGELTKEWKRNKSAYENRSYTRKTINYFNFDPNNLPTNKWKALGLSDKQIRVIHNYESKGGKFYKKEDLLKIYSISKSLYERLEPYIRIARNTSKEQALKHDIRNSEDGFSNEVYIELNSVDTAQLKRLRGIGSAYSKRIIKYRDLLGGYHSVSQLQEVYGLSSELFESIKPHCSADASKLKRININSCTAEELKKHPYIKWSVANSIIAIRKKHGSFSTLEQVKKSHLVNEELYIKIAPYLTL